MYIHIGILGTFEGERQENLKIVNRDHKEREEERRVWEVQVG
jgi:hypothetical protein